jgi:hypothetical protein
LIGKQFGNLASFTAADRSRIRRDKELAADDDKKYRTAIIEHKEDICGSCTTDGRQA